MIAFAFNHLGALMAMQRAEAMRADAGADARAARNARGAARATAHADAYWGVIDVEARFVEDAPALPAPESAPP